MTRQGWLAVAILLVGFFLRILSLNSGIADICLLPEQERWLYDAQQVSSLYAWNTDGVSPYVVDGQRQIAPINADLVMLRYAGVLMGVLVLALTYAICKLFRISSAILVMLIVACAWIFVVPDQWLLRFDGAVLVVAFGLLAVAKERSSAQFYWTLGRILSAVILLLVAPPLWWMALFLLIIDVAKHWRWVVFAVLSAVVLFPALRNPESWLQAAQSWDAAVTAALGWLVLVAAARYFKTPHRLVQWGIVGICGFGSLFLVAETNKYANPSDDDWEVIRALQDAIPENSQVELPVALLAYADVIACPLGAKLNFEAVAPVQDLVFRTQQPVQLRVVEGAFEGSGHLQPLDERYTLVRNIDVPNPTLIPVRDQLVILGSELVTPQLSSEGLLDIRLDFQMTNALNEQFSVYGLFVHLTQVGQPAEKVMEYGFPFGQELGTVQLREMFLNYHVRVRLPSSVPSGTYDVVVGIVHNVEVKEIARLVVGQVTVR